MKYIVCLPKGGICDMCAQILYSIDYAKKTERRCIILSENNPYFKENLTKYLVPSDGIISVSSKSKLDFLNNESIYPPELSGKITKFKSKYSRNHRGYILCNTSATPLRFNFSTASNYDNYSVIFHEADGSGLSLVPLMKYFNFSEEIKNEIKRRLKILPKNFIGVHVRHTDYNSNIQEFIAANSDKFLNNNIFLATDNFHVAIIFKALYKSRLYIFSDLPPTKPSISNGLPNLKSIPLHKNKTINGSLIKKSQQNLTAFCDLITLGLSDEILGSCSRGGFTKNARDIHNHKNLIIEKLN